MITMMIAELERKGLEISQDGGEIWLYANTGAEVSAAKKITRCYGYEISCYLPGSKIDDKAAEYQLTPKPSR